MRIAVVLMALAGCASPPRAETIAVPGTEIRLEMTSVAGVWISTREITWGEFDRFYQYPEEQRTDGVTRPSSGKNYLQLSGLSAEKMADDQPVTNLRYHSAVAFCEWLSRKTGMIFRLPTEVEWAAAPGKPQVLQYCLEPDRPPDFGPVLRGATREIVGGQWDGADPNRPVSTWWFRTGHTQGFRVVRVPGRVADAKVIEISGLKGVERVARNAGSVSIYSRVTGEIRNLGDRPIDELLLKVYFLDPKGQPHFEDITSNLTRRATYNVCAPVVRNSAHPGGALKPGERRTFSVDLPMTFDAESDVELEKFGATVLHALPAND
jgi:hypothetical protein